MKEEKRKWKKVGELQKGPKGNLYVKFMNDLDAKKGDYLSLQDPRVSAKNLLDMGKITEEEYNKKMEFIKDWYKYDVFLVE